jgi:hypothetical protein
MAKRTVKKAKRASPMLAATFEQNQHLGNCGLSVIVTDRYGKAWHINLETGHARPVTFGKKPQT